MPSKYGYSLDEWKRAKEEMRQILIERARARSTISYSELVGRVRAISLDPNSYALTAMLNEISIQEDAAGRGMLTVIVIHKYGDIHPGQGFFELAQSAFKFLKYGALYLKPLNVIKVHCGGKP